MWDESHAGRSLVLWTVLITATNHKMPATPSTPLIGTNASINSQKCLLRGGTTLSGKPKLKGRCVCVCMCACTCVCGNVCITFTGFAILGVIQWDSAQSRCRATITSIPRTFNRPQQKFCSMRHCSQQPGVNSSSSWAPFINLGIVCTPFQKRRCEVQVQPGTVFSGGSRF